MKMQSMAKFLIKGDLILHNRKKYEVVKVMVNGDTTSILYKTLKTDAFRIITKPSNEFFKIISPVEL